MESSSGLGEEEQGEPIFNDFHQEAPSSPSPSASSSSSYSHKLVPWLSWDEWLFVKDCLFSNSPDSVATAFRRISAWRSRGCLPVAIEVTASIIEIQQKDPHFRENQSNGASDNFRVDQTSYVQLSEDMLAMLYCMAIISSNLQLSVYVLTFSIRKLHSDSFAFKLLEKLPCSCSKPMSLLSSFVSEDVAPAFFI
nr:uncharacterized protein LOC112012976 [Quercus suber]